VNEIGLDGLVIWVAGAMTPRGGAGSGAGVGTGWAWVALGLMAVGVGILVYYVTQLRRDLSARERAEDADVRFAPGEVLADVDELSRRLAEELDRKAARLERLIAEADERLGRLEAALRRTGSAADGHVGPGEGALDPVSVQVYELADRGYSAVEIAQSLGQHVGKVELILALRR